MAAQPVLVQSNSSASSAAAPATYTHNFAQASAVGTLLVVVLGYAESAAPAITIPAGWLNIAGATVTNAGNTIGGRILCFPNNPGAISSIALTGLSGINGIAVAMFEFSNMAGVALQSAGVAQPIAAVVGASNSNATPGAGQTLTPAIGGTLWIGAEFDLTGQAYTPANLPSGAGYWITGPTATSTVGATNAVLRSFYTLLGPVPPPGGVMQCAGTLAGALANGTSMAALATANAGALLNAATGMGTDVLGSQAISVGGA